MVFYISGFRYRDHRGSRTVDYDMVVPEPEISAMKNKYEQIDLFGRDKTTWLSRLIATAPHFPASIWPSQVRNMIGTPKDKEARNIIGSRLPAVLRALGYVRTGDRRPSPIPERRHGEEARWERITKA